MLSQKSGTEHAATLGANPAEAECPVGTPSATTAEAPATPTALESEKQPTVDTPPVQATVTVVATTAPATTAATSAPTVVAAVTSANLPDNCDTRIVRFNNRDLENLRKIQDELNVRKAGGASPRAPGSPIVIKAELTNPNKVVTVTAVTAAAVTVAASTVAAVTVAASKVATVTVAASKVATVTVAASTVAASSSATVQTTAGATAKVQPQVLVVQKPLPASPNNLGSPKRADIRVIHPPGLPVRRQLQLTPTSLASGVAAGPGGLTKVVINPAGGGHPQIVGPVGATLQLVGTAVGQGAVAGAQPTTLLLSSPTRGSGGALMRAGQQLVRVAAPGSIGSAAKGMYVVSPMKLGGKVAMIPISVGKSPQRIAPAPSVSALIPSGATLGPTARLVFATASGATATTATATATTRATVPLSSVVPAKMLVRPMTASKLGTTATVVQSSGGATPTVTGAATMVTVTRSSGTVVQVPGSKFHYVRLVSAPSGSSTTSSGTTKVPTLIPLTSTRPFVAPGPVTSSATGALNANLRLAVPIAPATPSQTQAASGSGPSTQRVLIPASTVASVGSVRPGASLSSAQLGTLPAGTLLSTGGTSVQNAFVVVPAQYVAQFQQTSQSGMTSGVSSVSAAGAGPGSSRVLLQSSPGLLGSSAVGSQGGFVPIAAAAPTTASVSAQAGPDQKPPDSLHVHKAQVNGTSSEDNSRPRKPCNCTKSQCLKLYCDCFANGEFCHSCNCNNCFNNLEHEEERQKAISACLERNPNAFRPKIGKGKEGDHERRHTKGCNCKRSGCLKNYCECYEAKILCSSMCKCIGCKNFEDSSERKTLMQLADAAEVRVQQQAAARTKMSACDLPMRPPAVSDTGERLPFAFITQEVVEATCQCLLARAEEGDRLKLALPDLERSVLEEFGRCLLTIIDSANKTKGTQEQAFRQRCDVPSKYLHSPKLKSVICH
ncbi:protein lin-54 homolog isoform X2 [Ixodes scapularis]|uniref:protein lin-54 homolog isoform X2 n=1 Tax=Ixodes scapularis TaxID=6945 RepID=UPI001A9F99DC|nr:protein lin-54 homolog isoform X2 [Ixodes scapularis]